MNKDDIIRKYTDPSNPGSLSSIQTFLRENKYQDYNFVKRTLEDLETYSKFRLKKGEKKRRKQITTFPNEIICVDLADLSNYSRFNQGYKFLAVLVDGFSRYVYVYKLKDKSANSCAALFKEFFSLPGIKYSRVWSDAEPGFLSRQAKKY
jgi:hypothetical protein